MQIQREEITSPFSQSCNIHAPSCIFASHSCTPVFSVSHNGSAHLNNTMFWTIHGDLPFLSGEGCWSGLLSYKVIAFLLPCILSFLFLPSKLILFPCRVARLWSQQLSQRWPAEPTDTRVPFLQRHSVSYYTWVTDFNCLTAFDTIFFCSMD